MAAVLRPPALHQLGGFRRTRKTMGAATVLSKTATLSYNGAMSLNALMPAPGSQGRCQPSARGNRWPGADPRSHRGSGCWGRRRCDHSGHLSRSLRNQGIEIRRDLGDSHPGERRVFKSATDVVDRGLESPGTGPARPLVGRVSVEARWPLLSWPLDAAYYISGPPAMLKKISEDLRGKGISSDAIHIDAWE